MQPGPGQQPTTREGVMRVCPILVGAMMMGQVMFAALVGVEVISTGATRALKMDAAVLALFALVGVFGVAGFFALGAAWNSTAAKAWEKRADDADGELRIARALLTSTVLRAVLLEGPGLLAAVLAFLTGERSLLVLTVVCVLLLSTLLRTRGIFDATMARLTGRGLY